MKFVKSFLFAAVLVAGIFAVNSGSARENQLDNSYEGRARNAANACIQAAQQPGWEITGYAYETAICFVSGSLHQVDFVSAFRCNDPSGACPKIAARLVASVEFGCDDEIVNVVCY